MFWGIKEERRALLALLEFVKSSADCANELPMVQGPALDQEEGSEHEVQRKRAHKHTQSAIGRESLREWKGWAWASEMFYFLIPTPG